MLLNDEVRHKVAQTRRHIRISLWHTVFGTPQTGIPWSTDPRYCGKRNSAMNQSQVLRAEKSRKLRWDLTR